MQTIVFMGNNQKILKFLASLLESEGYLTITSGFDKEVLDIMESIKVDIIIVDAALKGVDSVKLIEDLTGFGGKELPLLVMADKSTVAACQESALLAESRPGYLCKPVVPEDLPAKVRQLLREKRDSSGSMLMGNVSLDAAASIVKTENTAVSLSRKEFAILQKLLTKPHHIFTREEILHAAWGVETDADARTVDVHIKRLRSKLEGLADVQIGTVRGVGYKAWVG